MVFSKLAVRGTNFEKNLVKICRNEGKSLSIYTNMTKNGKNSQNMKNKYTNVYLIRPSMENGPNKYIYKK